MKPKKMQVPARIKKAFLLSQDQSNVEFLHIDHEYVEALVTTVDKKGKESRNMVTRYLDFHMCTCEDFKNRHMKHPQQHMDCKIFHCKHIDRMLIALYEIMKMHFRRGGTFE